MKTKTRQTRSEQGPREAIDDPHRLARLYLAQHGREQDQQTLCWHRDEWHRWESTSGYTTIPAGEIRAEITAVTKREFDRAAEAEVAARQRDAAELSGSDDDKSAPPAVRKVTGALVTNVMRALESESMLTGRIEPPTWLDDSPQWPARETLATQSGLLHLPSFVSGKPSLIPPTPGFFSSNVLPYRFDPEANCPQWVRFLESLWPDDHQSIGLLQEWMGYCLLPDIRQHKLLMMIGPPRSGKGTINRVQRGLIGSQNLCSPTLSSLAGPFGLWPLLGKLVAVVADARLSGRTDAIAVVERLLSISGEDPQDVARKNLPTLTGQHLPVRFTIMTNELPNMRDASGALMTRVLLLRLTHSFTGREDRTLGKRLLTELPGILLWSIRGWERLQARGHFVQPHSGQELLDDLQRISSPITSFIDERCILGPEQEIVIHDLFWAWKSWCAENGRDHTGTEQTFGRDLRAARQEITVVSRRYVKRTRCYQGIGLRDAP